MEWLGEFSEMNISAGIDVIGVLSYVLLALGMYTIAKRRGIKKPWLAWIPVANVWLLGCLSDQYQYIVCGKQRSKRKAMLTLEIITVILSFVLSVLAVCLVFDIIGRLGWSLDLEMVLSDPKILAEHILADQYLVGQILGFALGILAIALPMCGCAIALTVLQFIAYKDIFASCDPENKTIYTVLGIVLSFFGLGILLSIFVFLCKNKDGGMPPRRDQQPALEVASEPVQEETPPEETIE